MLAASRAWIILLIILFIEAIASGLFFPVVAQILPNHALNTGDTLHSATEPVKNVVWAYGLVSALSPAFFLTAPIIGYFSDRWGRKHLLLPCVSFSCIAYFIGLIGSEFKSLFLLLLANTILSITTSSLVLIQAALADISFGYKRTLFFGVIGIAMLTLDLSGQAANAILVYLPQYITCNTLVGTALVLEIINFVLVKFVLPETRFGISASQDSITSITNFFKKRYVVILFFLFVCYEFGWGIYYQDAYNYLFRTLHYSTVQTEIFVSSLSLTMVLSLLFIYPLLTRFISLRKALILSLSSTFLGGIIAWYIHSLYALTDMAWFLVIGLGSPISTALLCTLLANSVSQKHQGLIAGLIGSGWSVAWMISGLITGPLSANNSVLPLQISSVVILICTIGGMLFFYKKKFNLGA